MQKQNESENNSTGKTVTSGWYRTGEAITLIWTKELEEVSAPEGD